MKTLTKENFNFLTSLRKNNNRDWFNDNKETYLKFHQEMIGFADEVLALMQQHDHIETLSGKKSLHRIYRDVRFSKDKSPYKNNWSGSFKRATKLLRGGYYFHIEPNNVVVAGGFWNPDKDDLARIREEIAADSSELNSIIKDPNFIRLFENLHGDQLKTSPKGYPKDHPDIELLRYKQFLVFRRFTTQEALNKNFAQTVNETFKGMRPFFDYMSEVLTTDANGQLLKNLK